MRLVAQLYSLVWEGMVRNGKVWHPSVGRYSTEWEGTVLWEGMVALQCWKVWQGG